MKILLRTTGLVLIVLAAMMVFGGHKVMADAQYCDVLAAPSNPISGTDAANCLAGQYPEEALTSLSGNSDQLKQQFENKITNYYNNGYGFQQIGAKYIEKALSGNDGTTQSACKDWKCNIEQSDVTFSIGNIPAAYNSCDLKDNTAYDTGGHDVIHISECVPSKTQTLIITQKGNIVYVIKLDCGNPMGNLNGPVLPPNHDPVGQIKYVTPTCDGTYNIKVTFQDVDAETTSAYIGDTAGHKVRGTSVTTTSPAYFLDIPASVMANNDYGGNFWPVQLWVKDVGPSGSGDYVDVDSAVKPPSPSGCSSSCPPGETGTPPNCVIPTGGNCPGDAKINASTLVTMQTPYNTPYGSASWSGRTTTAKNNVQYQDVATSNSNFKSVDISSGGQRTPPPITDYGANNQTATVNYSTFVNSYPYDSNQAEVTYATNYKETTWKADTFDHWSCNSGDANHNNGKCTHTYSAAESCPSGGNVTAKGCQHEHSSPATVNYNCPGGYQRRGSPPYYCHIVGKPSSYNISTTVSYSCSSGTLSGTSCITYTYTSITYSCNGGDSRSGTTCSHDYDATAYYRYTSQGTASRSQNNTSSGNYAMNACLQRQFDVNDVEVTATKNSNENPTQGTGSAVVSVTFSAPESSKGKGLRQPYRLSGVTFTANMFGEGMTCNLSSGASGSVTVPATMPQSSSSPFTTVASGTAGSSYCNVVPIPPTGSQVCATYTATPIGSTVDVGGTIQSYNRGRVSDTECSTPVVSEPYLKVFGGDVSAGNGFMTSASTACAAANPLATISAFNSGGSGNYRGAGTELAAISAKPIATSMQDEGFSSAQSAGPVLNDPANPSPLMPPILLALGNYVANEFGGGTPAPSYGGGYPAASTGACMPDYTTGMPAPASNNEVNGTITPNAVVTIDGHTHTSGSFVAPGSVTINGGVIAPGQHIVIYASGTVTITGNITFASSTYTSAQSIEDMPSFSVVTYGPGGQINIGGNVTRLDGNYIAQPAADGSGGLIDDCVPGPSYNGCSQKLIVHGSFIGVKIDLYRIGPCTSLRYAQGTETPDWSGNQPSCTVGTGGNNAAEEFDYTPLNWMSQPPPTSQPAAYDSITSLPPVL